MPIKHKVGDFAKVAKGAISITDDTINIKGKYVDDIAKYADDIAKPVDNIVKHLDDYKVIANKFPDEALPADGRILLTTIEDGRIKGLNGRQYVDFVVTKNGELRLGDKHAFLAGQDDVLAAGCLKVDGKGRIRSITNESGHYRPTVEEAMQFEKVFSELEMDLSKAWINYYKFYIDGDNNVAGKILVVSRMVTK